MVTCLTRGDGVRGRGGWVGVGCRVVDGAKRLGEGRVEGAQNLFRAFLIHDLIHVP